MNLKKNSELKHNMKWTVVDNKKETPIANTVTFHPERKVAFKAGQWFLLSAFIDGKKVKRAYSASSSPGEDYIKITSKLSQKPTFSKLLFDIKPGDFLDVEGPFGKFTYESGDGDELSLIGGGSGIAPLMSIVHYVIEEGLDVPITVIYSSKSEDLIIFKDEFTRIAAQHPHIKVHFTLTQELWEGLNGRISGTMIKELIPHLRESTYYLCGPPQMVNSIQQELIELGVPAIQIRTERYN